MGTTIRPEISKKNRYWIDKVTEKSDIFVS